MRAWLLLLALGLATAALAQESHPEFSLVAGVGEDHHTESFIRSMIESQYIQFSLNRSLLSMTFRLFYYYGLGLFIKR